MGDGEIDRAAEDHESLPDADDPERHHALQQADPAHRLQLVRLSGPYGDADVEDQRAYKKERRARRPPPRPGRARDEGGHTAAPTSIRCAIPAAPPWPTARSIT